MKQKLWGLMLFWLLFAVAGSQIINLATALTDLQYIPELTIKSDGSITAYKVSPSNEEFQPPEVINRTGNIYTLTSDIDRYAVRIDCNNIVLNGAGHTIHASGAFVNSGLRLLGVTNVTVKNLTVVGDRYISIFLVGSNCLITNVKTDALRLNGEFGFNTITESNITTLSLWRGDGNNISKCNISSMYIKSGSNLFTKNNLLCDNGTVEFSAISYTSNSWDNGSVGNYWINYQIKYPNATEMSNTGIGDTPYVIDQKNIDYHPLSYPYDIEKDAITAAAKEIESDSAL